MKVLLITAVALVGLGHCHGTSYAQVHGVAPKSSGAPAGAEAEPLDRADPHVAQLFNILRVARAQGDKLDMVKLEASLRDVGRAHAIEYEIDQAASEKMILQTAHNAWMAAVQNPASLASLDAFNKSIGAK
jgi:hypothetical protein